MSVYWGSCLLPRSHDEFPRTQFVLEQWDDEVRTAFDVYVDHQVVGYSVQIDPSESAQRYLGLLKHPSIPQSSPRVTCHLNTSPDQ